MSENPEKGRLLEPFSAGTVTDLELSGRKNPNKQEKPSDPDSPRIDRPGSRQVSEVDGLVEVEILGAPACPDRRSWRFTSRRLRLEAIPEILRTVERDDDA
jgi:hypothetical protein